MQAPQAREDHAQHGRRHGQDRTRKSLKAATEQLATIAGQQPSVRRARKSIAAFKLREGMPVGVSVTLRGERGYEFLDRLVSIAIPRIRDFRGLSPRSFDGRGNYSMGVKEQIIFPEIDYDAIDQVRGLDITITTTAATDDEAYALLRALRACRSPPRAVPAGSRPRRRAAPQTPAPTSSGSTKKPPPARDAGGRGVRRGGARRRGARRGGAGGRRPPPRRLPPRRRRAAEDEAAVEEAPSCRGGSGRGDARCRAGRSRGAAPGRRGARHRPRRGRGRRAGEEQAPESAQDDGQTPKGEHRLMAKTSQRVKQARPPKFKTRAYTRCNRCGRPRAVYEVRGLPHLPARARPQRPDPRDDEVLLVERDQEESVHQPCR